MRHSTLKESFTVSIACSNINTKAKEVKKDVFFTQKDRYNFFNKQKQILRLKLIHCIENRKIKYRLGY